MKLRDRRSKSGWEEQRVVAHALAWSRPPLPAPSESVRTTEGLGHQMFTGIVEECGEVVTIDDLDEAARLTVRGAIVTADARPGDSIAVDGCCLTVVESGDDGFTADVMRESLIRTALGLLAPGGMVNLERAVPAHGRMGGHLVQGHVDGTGTIRARSHSAHWDVLTVDVPARLARYLAPQGSIALDGVSLTIVDVLDGDAPACTVSLTPTTLRATTLGGCQPGDVVNIEVDLIAKYVDRLLGVRGLVEEAAS